MKTRLYFSIVFGAMLALSSCGNKPAEANTAATSTTTPATTATPTPVPAPTVSFVARELPSAPQSDAPLAEISVSVNGKATVVNEKAMGEFAEVDKAEYERYKLPAQTIVAFTGFWAGLGTTFYAIQKDNKIVVFEGFEDEGVPYAPENYKELKAIDIQ